MEEKRYSSTALITAFSRAYHSKYDNPKIFDDYLANYIIYERERVFLEHRLAEAFRKFYPDIANSCPNQAAVLANAMRIQNAPITLSRSRYTEESLKNSIKKGVKQYVVLGAGFDTFAFRKPELLTYLQVFEVDHPATQMTKRIRINELGWAPPQQLHYIPIDFTVNKLEKVLKNSAYDTQKMSLFSWLGVTYYLTLDVVLETLRTIVDIAPSGSIIIFDYMDKDAFVPEKASKRIQQMQESVRNMGEPMRTGFDPDTISDDLKNIGLILKENLSPSDIEERYFKQRTDGYHAYEHVHFAYAEVE